MPKRPRRHLKVISTKRHRKKKQREIFNRLRTGLAERIAAITNTAIEELAQLFDLNPAQLAVKVRKLMQSHWKR